MVDFVSNFKKLLQKKSHMKAFLVDLTDKQCQSYSVFNSRGILQASNLSTGLLPD